jgi:hypothetical protein
MLRRAAWLRSERVHHHLHLVRRSPVGTSGRLLRANRLAASRTVQLNARRLRRRLPAPRLLKLRLLPPRAEHHGMREAYEQHDE